MTDDFQNSTFDQLLDRVLRGDIGDLDELLASNESLSPAERVRLRSMAEALGRTRAESELDPDTEPPTRDRPQRIGEYRVIKELGRGGMGVVFLAEDVALERRAAIKVLRSDVGSSPEAAERFRREAQAVARVNHPNVVTIYGAGAAAGLGYIAMEYIEGRGLDELIVQDRTTGQAPNLRKYVAHARDLARALAAAHERGIVHRDVKPSNVRIGADDRTVLVDFGLAHDDALGTLTVTGTFRGSPHYASPEQVAARRIAIDLRTDIYSLGATLYEAVTSRVPFPGETKEQVFNQILVKDPTPPRRLNPRVSKDLETVILKAMEKDRERRYASATALADDLDALLEMRPILARPAGPLRRAATWIRRHPGVTASAMIAVLAVMAFASSFFVQQWRAERERERRVAGAEALSLTGPRENALVAWQEFVALYPNDQYARRRLEEATAALRLERADMIFGRAEVALSRYVASLDALAPAFEEAPPLRKKRFSSRPMTDDEVARLQEVERRLGTLEFDSEEWFFRALELINDTEQLAGTQPRTNRLRCDLYFARWREAKLKDETSTQAVLAQRVANLDAEGRYAGTLNNPGTVTFTGVPGTTIHLFRYVPHHEVVEGGDLRLIPVPTGGAPTVPPGSYCLRSTSENASLAEGDLVLSVAGWPLREVVPVIQGGGPIERMDRVVRIGDRTIHTVGEYLAACRALKSPTWVFERQGSHEEVVLGADDVADLGIRVGSFVELLANGETPVRLLKGNELRETTLAAGTRVVPTAAPLELTSASLAGDLPLAATLTAGNYLAVARAPNKRLLRTTFRIESRNETTVAISWPDMADAPVPFVPIPSARLTIGLDPRAEPSDVEGFWIMDREVLGREYQEFLDDAETLREIQASPEPIRAPRSGALGRTALIWARQIGDRVVISDAALDRPLCGISLEDAAAYARFRTRKAVEAGLPYRFALPTEAQWELAAVGTDGRALPFGSYLIPRWAKIRAGSPFDDPEAPYSFPIDESPYGVFDLTGSMFEWTTSPAGDPRLRGGSWTSMTRSIETAIRESLVFAGTSTSNQFGLRLVLRIDE